jgi:hypothetical protein
MEPTEHEVTKDEFSESVATLLRSLPAPIRTFVQSSERDELMRNLVTTYHLHADQAGALEKALLFMLLGVYSPEEFMSTLREGGLTEDTINSIAVEINEKVFKPIQNEERKVPSSPPVVLPIPQASPAPVEKHINRLEVAPVPVPPVPVAPPVVKPVPEVKPLSSSIPAPKPASVTEQGSGHGEQPQMRTMAADIEAVKEHRAPSAFFTHGAPIIAVPPRLPVIPSGPGSTNTAPPKPAPVAPPPANPVVAAVSEKMPPAPVARTAPPPSNLPGTPLIKEYGTDPYREAPE